MRTAASHAKQSSATSATIVLLSVYQHTLNASLVITVPTHVVQTACLHRTCTGILIRTRLHAWSLTPRHDSLGGVTLHGCVNKSLHSLKAGKLHQARAQNGASTCNTHTYTCVTLAACHAKRLLWQMRECLCCLRKHAYDGENSSAQRCIGVCCRRHLWVFGCSACDARPAGTLQVYYLKA